MLDGSKVLVKLAENPFAFAKRCRPFFGGTDYSNYTIEADVRAMERRRQMGDVGIVAQRYELVLFGNHQRLELQPWQPETQRTRQGRFPWKPDTWYTMKLEVQTLGKRQGPRARQGVAEGRARAGGVDDRARRSDRQPQGQRRACMPTRRRSAGGGSEIYYDNIKVYHEQDEPSAVRSSARNVKHDDRPCSTDLRWCAALLASATALAAARSDPEPATGRCGAARPTATWSRA